MGGDSQVSAYLNLMEECVSSGEQYGHVFLLSGLDYPLWPNSRIMDYLERHPQAEFIRGRCITGSPMGDYKCRQYHFFRDFKTRHHQLRRCLRFAARSIMQCLPFRKKDYVVTNGKRNNIYFTSTWFCLTGRCLAYVYDQLAHNKDWERYFRYAMCPDELVVATIVFNSPFGANAYRWKEEDGNGLEALTMLHYIEYTDAIRIYDERDYDKLMNSGKMFVRKLTTQKSLKLMELIDKAHKLLLMNEKNDHI